MRPLPLVLVGSAVLAIACAGGTPPAVTAADKAIAITPQTVQRTHVVGYDPSRDQWEMSHFLGDWELSYEYDGADLDPPLYVVSMMSHAASVSDAQTTITAQGIGIDIGMGGELERERRDDLLAWGDEHECELLKSGGEPVGNLCQLREGRRTWLFMVVGAVYTEPGEITEAFRPELEAWSTWDPGSLPR